MKQVDPYEELNVNVHGVLKPPVLLWLIMLIETWHFWAFLLGGFSGQTWLIPEETGWMNFVIEAPALLVMISLGARVPGAFALFRFIWRHGREFLAIAASGNLALILYTGFQDGYWRVDVEWPTLLVVVLHIWVLLRLWFSPIISKVFSEFPAPPKSKNSKA
jgi:hypothetical protein